MRELRPPPHQPRLRRRPPGPTCRARIATAITTATASGKLDAYQPAQLTKAVEVI